MDKFSLLGAKGRYFQGQTIAVSFRANIFFPGDFWWKKPLNHQDQRPKQPLAFIPVAYMYGIFTRICHQKSTIHVGTYTRPMDGYTICSHRSQSKQLTSRLDSYTTMSGENVTQLFAQISVPRNFRSSTQIFFWLSQNDLERNDCNKTLRLDLTVVTFSK